ncbi:hypothetical protein NX10_10250 [Pseudomonas fluorescens]|uniref:hypothetical protein n=1 Tax=Pseudomonas fluorescens group TaxID=136843 RepID=UPI000584FCE0|nr:MULTISPECIES: hypothetical protein [Pseudomonas fluorescens group]KIF62839.1 hypothetical protein NX10_10250 [Pseudomonas fluorescens]MDR7057245.1 hypothetical protein [Pseudomonas koreensis]
MSTQSSDDKTSDISNTNDVSAIHTENFENENYQTFETGQKVSFSSGLDITIEDQPTETYSKIAKLDEPGFGEKSLFLPAGSRLKLSFGGLINSVSFKVKPMSASEHRTAYVWVYRDGVARRGTPIFIITDEYKSSELTADSLFITGFGGLRSVTTGDLYLDNVTWTTLT